MRVAVRRLPAGAWRFGVCAVECVVSGQYFHYFPSVRHVGEEAAAAEAGGGETATAAGGATAVGVARCLRQLATAAAARLGPPAADNAALLFLPGFNTPIDCAMQRLGQLLALARLPPHLKPIVFSWPDCRGANPRTCPLGSSEEPTHRT